MQSRLTVVDGCMLSVPAEMMQHDPIMCAKAMGIHNAVLRKVATAHAGHIIEQEGDSWAVAFHRPVDAVAFCLQVGLMDCLFQGVVNLHARASGVQLWMQVCSN